LDEEGKLGVDVEVDAEGSVEGVLGSEEVVGEGSMRSGTSLSLSSCFRSLSSTQSKGEQDVSQWRDSQLMIQCEYSPNWESIFVKPNSTTRSRTGSILISLCRRRTPSPFSFSSSSSSSSLSLSDSSARRLLFHTLGTLFGDVEGRA